MTGPTKHTFALALEPMRDLSSVTTRSSKTDQKDSDWIPILRTCQQSVYQAAQESLSCAVDDPQAKGMQAVNC